MGKKLTHSLMALPQSIAALSQQLGGTGVQDIVIQCFYCGRPLSWAEKVLYDSSNIPVILYRECFYASCHPCVTANARLDFVMNYEGVTSAAEVELRYGKTIENLSVRCVSCLRELTRTEKRDVQQTDPDLFMIRDTIRTLCIVCRVGLR